MHSRKRDSHASGTSRAPISRRKLLAVSGIVAFSGLSGCLGRVASAVTNTGASPAAVFAGGGGGRAALTEPRVVRLTPTFSADLGGVSGEVELEGWVTAASVMTSDYNSSRSNKPSTRSADDDADADGVDDGTAAAPANYNNTRSNRSTARPPEIVDDDLEEDDETFQVVSRLDSRLKEATAAAWAAISKRSARTGRNPELDKEVSAAMGDMDTALAELRAALQRCSSESCVVALGNVADREADLARAKGYIENEEWAAFGLRGGDDNDILVGDYLLPPATFDPAGAYSAGEQAALYRYLDGDAVVAERVTVCLPDAEVPGGNGSLRAGVTPKRIIDYLTGHGGGTDHAWGGRINAAADGGGDCDDEDPGNYPGAVCGSSPHFVAAVTGPVTSGGSLEAVRASDGTLVVMTTGPTSESGPSVLVCPADGEAYEPANLRSWGARSTSPPTQLTQQGRIQDVTVAQVQVQPPGCPHPVSALFYVGRGESDGQLIYSGGWVIDDAALYETASTVLSMAGPTQVVGIECCFDYSTDADGDGFGDVVKRSVSGERAWRGARLDTGTVGELVEKGVLTDGGKQGNDPVVRKKPGRTSETDGEPFITHLALDAPVLHLVNAANASNEVKFKAGAELSKAVN